MLAALLRTMRPHQWVKNAFVLAPIVFAQELFTRERALPALGAFVSFSLFSSSVYVLNDLVDVKEDREHPIKKLRPIASGALTEMQARFGMIGLLLVASAGAIALGTPFLATVLGYVVLNLAYSFGLKKIAYADVLSLAGMFELRVLSGSFAADVPPSTYLLVVTFLLASFLGFGKRAHELTQQGSGGETRKALRVYDPRVVAGLLFLTGAATVATYAAYTLDAHTVDAFGTPYLVLTTAFVLFGILRFVVLVRRPGHDSPTDAMLRDPAFLANAVVGALSILAIIYLT